MSKKSNAVVPKMSLISKLKVIAKALTISLKVKKPYSLAVSLLGFLAALIPVAISNCLGDFTNHVQALYLGQETAKTAVILLIAMVGLYLLQVLYNVAENYCVRSDRISVEHYIKESVMQTAASVEYKYIENESNFQDRLSFIESDGGYRVAQSMNLVVGIVHALITFVTVSVAMATIDWRVLLVLLVTSIPAVIVSSKQNIADYSANARNMKEMRMTNRLYSIADGFVYDGRAFYTTKFSGAYPWFRKRWREVADDYIGKKRAVSRKFLLWNLLADFLRNGVLLVVLLITAQKIYENPAIGLGVFMSVYLLSRQMQTVTGKLFTSGTALMGDAHYMKDFFDLQDIPKEPEEKEPEQIKDADIVCDHVSFSYPNSEREVLHDVSITIRQGEKIAIVGHNGSGKSTFVNLLCGMYEPSKGQVQIGGKKVYDHLGSVRNAISVAFQRFGRYETTLRENITVGDTSRAVSDDELLNLAKHTGADEVISEQPNGLSENIGSFSERGNNLSGGQWQKIALTRALIRKDSRIIILDEPTAALDPIAEAELYREFAALTEDKTTLLISHRLGITSVVDRILVFDDGRVVEDGSHEQLMKLDGVYAKLYRAQAEWYR